MDFPIHIIWMSPFSFLGASGVIFSFLFHFSMKFMKANIIALDGAPRFAASHLGLFCFPMPHKKDARLPRRNDDHGRPWSPRVLMVFDGLPC